MINFIRMLQIVLINLFNFRIKTYNFEKIGFQFEIPKLKLDDNADWGIRILLTDYDHYSHHCKTFSPRIKAKPERKYHSL